MAIAPRKTSAQGVTPVIARLYVAEDFRQETSGKVTAVGLFPDNIIVSNLPAGTPLEVDKPAGIHDVAFMVSVHGIQGDHKVGFEFLDGAMPKAQPTQAQTVSFPHPKRSNNFTLVMRPFIYSSFGTKRLRMLLDDAPIDLEYEIRRTAEG